MVVLCEQTIRDRIGAGNIKLMPEVEEDQFQPASLDVRIDGEYYDMDNDNMVYSDVIQLKPHTPYLGTTLDYISLPDDIAAVLTGRSSVGRKGVIIHKTAGWIDPGFRGNITLEMMNFTDTVVEFKEGERVGQLVFFLLDRPTREYDGQFQNQDGVTHARD